MQRWVLRTASFRENIIWLKHYNARVPRNQRIQIFGIGHYLTNNAQEIQLLDLHHRDYQQLANRKIWIHDIPAIRIDKKYAFEKIKPIKHFDGIVYVRTSHPSHILYMNK